MIELFSKNIDKLGMAFEYSDIRIFDNGSEYLNTKTVFEYIREYVGVLFNHVF